MWDRTLTSICGSIPRRLSCSHDNAGGGNSTLAGRITDSDGVELLNVISKPTRLSGYTRRLEESYRAFGVTVSRFASLDGSQMGAKFELSTAESGFGTSSSSSGQGGFGLRLMTAAKAGGEEGTHGAQTFIPITAPGSQSARAFALVRRSDDPQLNSAIILGQSGSDPAQLKMDVAYFASLRSGLEHTGTEMVITQTGVFFRVLREGRGGESLTTAIERYHLLEGIPETE